MDMIEVFGHGGDMETAAAVFGRRATDFVDFSANINPLGPPPEVREALRSGLRAVIRYPDPGHRTLKSLLSRSLQLAPEWIGIGNGAAECMALVLLALAPARVGIVEPCFSEYAELAAKFGAEVSRVYGRASQQWRADKAEMVGLMEEVDVLFLGQPNNPNGVQYGQEELDALAAASARTGTVLVVDEAFTDFIPVESRVSLLQSLERYPNVILIRSMTKFYAIPGLRLGYTVAHPGMIRRLTAKQVTWSVNGLALLAGEACLHAGADYEERTLELVQTERARLLAGLAELGCAVIPGEANYLLVRAPGMWRAVELQEALGRRGILIRSCAMYPGLSENHFRVAVKERKDNLLLLDTLGRVLEEERRDR